MRRLQRSRLAGSARLQPYAAIRKLPLCRIRIEPTLESIALKAFVESPRAPESRAMVEPGPGLVHSSHLNARCNSFAPSRSYQRPWARIIRCGFHSIIFAIAARSCGLCFEKVIRMSRGI